MALLVIGSIFAGSSLLQRIAEGLQMAGISEAKMPSIERGFARFVANERIVVSEVCKQFLSQVLPYWHGKSVRLVLDGTPWAEKATMVYLGLLVQSRVLPLQDEWEEAQWKLVGEMFDEVKLHLVTCEGTLIADRGLSGALLVQLCRDRHWHYLLGICKEQTVRHKLGQRFSAWTAWAVLVHQTRQQWFGRVLCWQEHTIETYLSAVWDADHRQDWFLISDQPAGRRRVQEYAWGMRVESTFQDAKSRGWDLEASVIADRERLNRRLLALFVAMWWVIHLAASCIHHGQRDRFDRHDRRDKSVFRLGCLWLKDILRRISASAFAVATLTCCLSFRKTASGWRFSLRF